MKWRMIDSLDGFQPWTRIRGRKAVSLEEYSLLEPLGRKGCFPESLLLETGVQLGRWLVVASSGFTSSCDLSEVERFAVSGQSAPGDVLTLSATVISRTTELIKMSCEIKAGGHLSGQGVLLANLVPLEHLSAADDSRTLWRELYGKA